MPISSNGYTESTINVGGGGVLMYKGGTGRPVLVLHEELGHPGWLAWHADLSQDHQLLIPVHPGFGALPRIDWISGVRDLAGFYSRMLRDLALGPVDVIGFSLGGWIAAEMAAADAGQFDRMVLVAPTGLRPPEGEIMDLFVVTARNYLNASVRDGAANPGIPIPLRRRRDGRTVRGLGRRPRRGVTFGLETLHAQPQPGTAARGSGRTAHVGYLGPGRRHCPAGGRSSL